MAKQRIERVTANITDIKDDISNYPELAKDVSQDLWDELSDAQRLVYLAKQTLKRVKSSEE